MLSLNELIELIVDGSLLNKTILICESLLFRSLSLLKPTPACESFPMKEASQSAMFGRMEDL